MLIYSWIPQKLIQGVAVVGARFQIADALHPDRVIDTEICERIASILYPNAGARAPFLEQFYPGEILVFWKVEDRANLDHQAKLMSHLGLEQVLQSFHRNTQSP